MTSEKSLINEMKAVFGDDKKRIGHDFLTSAGQIYNFLEIDKTKEVICTGKHHNKSIKIIGKLFTKLTF